MSSTIERLVFEPIVGSRKRPPVQTGLMTWNKLHELIKAGFGQGHLGHYKAWLRVTKRDYSQCSTIGHLPSPEFGHMHHFRSLSEADLIRFLQWLGAHDVRDAFPLWPWDAPHPLVGLPSLDAKKIAKGMWKIADEARISHGYFPGSNIPYVCTLDVLATWRVGESYTLTAHSCKPWSIANRPSTTDRAKEKLELERLYCREADIPYAIFHGEKLPAHFKTNLAALNPRLSRPKQEAMRGSDIYRRIVDWCSRWAYTMPPSPMLPEIAKQSGATCHDAVQSLQLAIWHQDVDHDLSLPYEPWEPLVQGGRRLKANMKRNYVGDIE